MTSRLAPALLFIAIVAYGGTSSVNAQPAVPTLVSPGSGVGSLIQLPADTPVYLLPDTSRQPLMVAKAGSSVRVLGTEGAWVNVQFQDGQYGRRVGYVESRLLALGPPAAPVAPRVSSPAFVAPTPPPPVAPTPSPAAAAIPAPTLSSSSGFSVSKPLYAGPQLKASTEPLNISKGANVVITIPVLKLTRDGVRLNGGVIYSADIRKTADGVEVGDSSDWQDAGCA